MPTNTIGLLTALAPYSQAELAAVNAIITKDGYAWGIENELAVTAQVPPAMAVNVDTGWIFIQGYWKHNPTLASLNIDAAHATKNRIDRIIAKVMPLAGTFTIEVLKGADFVGTPTAPTLTRTALQWECSLAQVYVGAAVASINQGNITWEGDDYTVCGAAAGQANVKANVLQTVTLPQLNGSVTGWSQNHGNYPAIAYDGTNVYVIGGATTTTAVSKFDLTTWTTKTVMTTGRDSLRSTYYSGDIYCIGGKIVNTPSKKNEAYNIAGDSFAAKTDKITATYDHAQCESGGIIYCFGGNTNAVGGYTHTKILEAYNVAGNSWSALLDLPCTLTNLIPMQFQCCADDTGTYIYVFWTEYVGSAYQLKFYRYDIGANTYTLLTASSVQITNGLFYSDGAIYGLAGAQLMKYTIATDTWTVIIASSGISAKAVQLTDRRFFTPVYSGTNSKLYTHYYYLGTATANSLAMFRSRSDINLQLMNITSGYAGEMVGLKLNDLYGIYVNLITVTAVGNTVEIMG